MTRPRGDRSGRARSLSRRLALQALYQVMVGRNGAEEADTFTRGLVGFHKADSVHFDATKTHCLANVGNGPAEVLTVTTMGLFDDHSAA